MKRLNVAHFLGVYKIRKGMQDAGITNPNDEVKEFTKAFVEKLSTMPMDEEVRIDGLSFLDSRGNIIASFPISQNN